MISAIRTSRPYRIKADLLAAVATAAIPLGVAGLFLYFIPAACEIRNDPALYRWTCLLPWLLLVVPAALAILLPIGDVINHRTGRRFPDGWLVGILAAGLLTHVVLTGIYLTLLGPAYLSTHGPEVISVPQPFVAGAIAGAVFWLAQGFALRLSWAK